MFSTLVLLYFAVCYLAIFKIAFSFIYSVLQDTFIVFVVSICITFLTHNLSLLLLRYQFK